MRSCPYDDLYPADRCGSGAPGRARAAHRRSKSFYVRAALHEYLTDLEDAFAADAAIDAFDAGGRRSRPLSAVKAETDA